MLTRQVLMGRKIALLTDAERRVLESAISEVRPVAARTVLVRKGVELEHSTLLLVPPRRSRITRVSLLDESVGKLLEFGDVLNALYSVQAAECNEEASDTIENLEGLILNRVPSNANEAATILEVLLWNISPGIRTDGRDIIALQNLKSWCDTLASGQASLAAPTISHATDALSEGQSFKRAN